MPGHIKQSVLYDRHESGQGITLGLAIEAEQRCNHPQLLSQL